MLVLFFVSCSDNNKKQSEPSTSVTLTTDKTAITADGTDAATLTVMSGKNDVTSKATFKVDGKELKGNKFTSTEPGIFKIVASVDGKDTNDVTVEAKAKEYALQLTANKEALLLDGNDEIIFTVKTKADEDITSKATIKVNGIEISGNKYIPSKVGEYKAEASFNGQSSNILTFQVNEVKDIILEADNLKFVYDGGQTKVTFKVKDKEKKDITAECKFFVNDKQIESNVFTPPTYGNYLAYAMLGSTKSNPLTIFISKPIEYGFELRCDKTEFTADNVDMSVFTCINVKNKDDDFTKEAEFFVNGQKMTSNYLKTDKEGTYTISAKYKDYPITPITVKAVKEYKPTSRIYVEDFTGTWCPYCPRGLFTLEEAAKNPRVIPMAMHSGSGRDPFDHPDTGIIATALGIEGFPTLALERDKKMVSGGAGISASYIISKIKPTTPIGIAIETKVVGNCLQANVTFKATEKMDVNVVAILSENKLIADQANAVAPELGNPIKNMEHNHVYRMAYNNKVWGEPFSIRVNETKTKSYTFEMKGGWVANNCEVVILVTNPDKTVINAQKAKAGSGGGF